MCGRFYSGKKRAVLILMTGNLYFFNGFLINQFLLINLCLIVCKQLHQKSIETFYLYRAEY